MMQLYDFMFLLFIHHCGDFVFQTEWQARNKSSLVKALLTHTGVYTLTWFLACVMLVLMGNGTITVFDLTVILLFCLITFVCHTITDFCTSKWTKKLAAKEKWYDNKFGLGFFAVVNIDQMLHYAQLVATFPLILHLINY